MSGVNRVFLIGNLCAKPELKFLPSGEAVCEMRLATNETWFDKKSNKKMEAVEFHSVSVWGKSAENCGKYLDKGSSVFFEGKLKTRSWDDKKTGEKKYKTEIVARSVQFLDDAKKSGGQRDQRDDERQPGDDDLDF